MSDSTDNKDKKDTTMLFLKAEIAKPTAPQGISPQDYIKKIYNDLKGKITQAYTEDPVPEPVFYSFTDEKNAKIFCELAKSIKIIYAGNKYANPMKKMGGGGTFCSSNRQDKT